MFKIKHVLFLLSKIFIATGLMQDSCTCSRSKLAIILLCLYIRYIYALSSNTSCVILYKESCTHSIFAHAHTVEPLNKGHFGSTAFVLYWEAVLSWEVRITIVSTRVMSIGAIASVLHTEVVLWWEGPL